MNVQPANNIQLAAVAGFTALLVEHLCQANGITIPTDIADALPGVMAILVAHLYDLFTGENKPPKPPAA
jgi:uncharacterized membrane protein